MIKGILGYKSVDRFIQKSLGICTLLVVILTFFLFFPLVIESLRFFQHVSIVDFLTGTRWDPVVLENGQCLDFGVLPLLIGTLIINGIALIIAVPFGLLSAVYLSEYASKRTRIWVKPLLEMLVGIPTVVYGFFAALIIAPLFNQWGEHMGIYVAMESAIAAGLVMGFMILPYIFSLCDDILRSVPFSLREGALALGSTPTEMIHRVVLPTAFPGIIAAFLLAVSRAMGETMLVVMAAGMTAYFTFNPLRSVTTVTVQIVALLTGDQELESPKTLAAFALGLVLFILTLIINLIALRIVRRYRKQYV